MNRWPTSSLGRLMERFCMSIIVGSDSEASEKPLSQASSSIKAVSSPNASGKHCPESYQSSVFLIAKAAGTVHIIQGFHR